MFTEPQQVAISVLTFVPEHGQSWRVDINGYLGGSKFTSAYGFFDGTGGYGRKLSYSLTIRARPLKSD